MTLPPRPPSPPSGPPIGTNFSRRKETMPDPPSPAFTWMRTRSMNVISYPVPEPLRTRHQRVRYDGNQRMQHVGHDSVGDTDIARAVQMRLELPVLCRGGARGDDAELPARQVERRAAQHLAIAFRDHPVVQERVQLADVHAQAV